MTVDALIRFFVRLRRAMLSDTVSAVATATLILILLISVFGPFLPIGRPDQIESIGFFMPNLQSPVIELRDVHVRYVKGPPWARTFHDALRGVDVSIQTGQMLGLVGESGSGKSTIGRICIGLLRQTGGTASFDGRALFGVGQRSPGVIGAVLQHPEWSLDPLITIAASVEEPLKRMKGVDKAEHRDRVADMLGKVGLRGDLMYRYPKELSGGQRQRASIGRALITQPRFILFGEAVSALDVSIQAQILNLIGELQQSSRFAALFISHDLAAVRYVADEIAVLHAGKIAEHAPARFPLRNDASSVHASATAC